MSLISGQKPVVTKFKKSISNFKTRKGSVAGVKVTLRSNRMYEFLDRLVNIALPRIKDFRGLSLDGFDEFGSNELTGPFTFTDVDNDKRSEISKNIESHADALVNDHKVESAALTHREQSELAENINLATGGGAGALNDTFSLFETSVIIAGSVLGKWL